MITGWRLERLTPCVKGSEGLGCRIGEEPALADIEPETAIFTSIAEEHTALQPKSGGWKDPEEGLELGEKAADLSKNSIGA